MSQSSDNPYQSPQTPQADAATLPENPGLGLREKVRRFRRQMHVLGLFWIYCGMAIAGTTFAIGLNLRGELSKGEVLLRELISGLVVGWSVALVWLIAGVLALAKRLWAARLGQSLSILALVVSGATVNLIGIALLGFVAYQAHRVVRWGRELEAAGIPLSAQPEDVKEVRPDPLRFRTTTSNGPL